ncbi:TPA: hypothetical protein ACKP7W_000034 [Stenotrophomonas maltophilia]|uniref:hypothetical protein n=1 Tax=Stenotrophomonas sp. PE591 TaxID=1812490 RepID=UPI001BB05CE9|nr:hypothetical protein [Stenotrophomonas sp. PE591]MBS3726917.1 hypothetical protein [Stenotrophomonas sp. PE591]
MISRKLLCTATLLCLAPFAASAAEAHLTPSTNGGSGAMPSGYSRLYFSISGSDFADQLKLPENPRLYDEVVLSSSSAKSSRLDAAATAAADLAYIPVENGTRATFTYNDREKRWMLGGRSDNGTARFVLKDGPHAEMQMTEARHINVHVTRDAVTSVGLPAWAPGGAILGLVNYTSHDVSVKGVDGNAPQACPASDICAFVFDQATGAWQARRGRAHFQPTSAQLPMLEQRWTDLVLNGPAEDIVTPQRMLLPTDGIEGDILQASDRSNSRYYKLGGYSLGSKPVTFRYDAQRRSWVKQPEL